MKVLCNLCSLNLFLRKNPKNSTMDLTRFLTDTRQRLYLKITLLLVVSYFFVGISEGAFFNFSSSDTLINFVFTLFCVGSSWVLFKQLYPKISQLMMKWTISPRSSGLAMVLLLSVYITLLNWTYIELLWMENLRDTLFFSIVLPLAVVLFLAWSFLYPRLQDYLIRSAASDAMVFEVNKGREKVRVPVDQVLGFAVENKLTFLIAHDGQKYISDQNLTALEELLTDHGFFRANRQLLIVKAAVAGYKSCVNEKIQVSLHEAFGETMSTRISRYKAAAFRQWIAL